MIYLDNAATTFPKPPSVIRSTLECMKKYCGNPARSSHELSVKASEAVYDTREAIAELLHIKESERVVFTLNATYALNLAIKTTITEKCHVIISDAEHNSVLRPIKRLEEDLGVEYSTFNSYSENLEDEIISHIREDTKAIISTLASNVTGKRIPLDTLSKIGKRYHLVLIVDAAQAIGHNDIDLSKTPCDVLCAPGHKALFGIQGCGFAVFCDRRQRKSLIEGGSGTDSKSRYMPELLPERFEAGTLPTPAIVSLRAGISYIKLRGLRDIAQHISALEGRFSDILNTISGVKIYSEHSGIISFSYKDIPSSVIAEELNSRKICTRSGLHCAPMIHEKLGSDDRGLVRISLSALNDIREADKFYSAFKEISKKY